MRAFVTIVLAIVAGIVGGWVGYWIGHAFGWTTNAVWPWQVGGGDRAIFLSILASMGSVAAVGGWLVARPMMQLRRLLANGRRARATVLRVWRTGFFSQVGVRPWRELGFEVEVHPAGQAAYTARGRGHVNPADVGAFAPGAEVNVRYDPAKPTQVAVESLAAPSPA
jgi:MFS family permease